MLWTKFAYAMVIIQWIIPYKLTDYNKILKCIKSSAIWYDGSSCKITFKFIICCKILADPIYGAAIWCIQIHILPYLVHF